jgi:hypothetical protein
MEEEKTITYDEFQLRLFKKVFEDIKNDEFMPCLALLTASNNTKIVPIPGSLYNDKDKLDSLLSEIAGLGNSTMCCFVSTCMISKIDKDESPEMFNKFKGAALKDMTDEELKELHRESEMKEGLI